MSPEATFPPHRLRQVEMNQGVFDIVQDEIMQRGQVTLTDIANICTSEPVTAHCERFGLELPGVDQALATLESMQASGFVERYPVRLTPSRGEDTEPSFRVIPEPERAPHTKPDQITGPFIQTKEVGRHIESTIGGAVDRTHLAFSGLNRVTFGRRAARRSSAAVAAAKARNKREFDAWDLNRQTSLVLTYSDAENKAADARAKATQASIDAGGRMNYERQAALRAALEAARARKAATDAAKAADAETVLRERDAQRTARAAKQARQDALDEKRAELDAKRLAQDEKILEIRQAMIDRGEIPPDTLSQPRNQTVNPDEARYQDALQRFENTRALVDEYAQKPEYAALFKKADLENLHTQINSKAWPKYIALHNKYAPANDQVTDPAGLTKEDKKKILKDLTRYHKQEKRAIIQPLDQDYTDAYLKSKGVTPSAELLKRLTLGRLLAVGEIHPPRPPKQKP